MSHGSIIIIEEAAFYSFNVIAATFHEHYDEILNFYNNRFSNAAAESFNAKIKSFRAALRGVVDINPTFPHKNIFNEFQPCFPYVTFVNC